MQVAGAAGVLLNGAVRDVEELKELGLPIWTEFIRVRGATKANFGRLNCPVALGGTIIYPGDIVTMDADGAITVQPNRLDEVLALSEERAAKEEGDRIRFQNGERSYDRQGWRKNVETYLKTRDH